MARVIPDKKTLEDPGGTRSPLAVCSSVALRGPFGTNLGEIKAGALD